MVFEGFKIHTHETIDAHCNNPKCLKKPKLIEVTKGFIGCALFCTACHSVYELKIERAKKVSPEFMQKCLDEASYQHRKKLLIVTTVLEEEDRLEKENMKKAKKLKQKK